MSFLQPADFTGSFAITTAFDNPEKLQEYIDFFETKYLNELLGAELYVLFLAGFESDEIYEKLYAPFSFDSEKEGRPLTSYGMLDMLKRFIYAHYCNGDRITPTSAGAVFLDTEAATKVKNAANYYDVFNAGVVTYKTIRAYILENRADYPEFKGVYLGFTWDL